MTQRLLTLCFVAFAAVALGFIGCGKDVTVQSVCEGLETEADQIADCVEEFTGELAECANSDEVLVCISEADGESALEDCFDSCEATESE